MDWADFGPNTIILFWARPGPEDWAGPGPAWPSNKRWRGELFSPHPSACRTLFVLHAGTKKKENAVMKGGRRITWRGGGGGAGGTAAAGGGAVAEAGGSRTAAVVLLSQPNGSVTVFFQVFPSVSSFPLLYFGSSPF